MSVLNEGVMVLNKVWQPTAVTTVRGSMIALYTGKAKVVDPIDYSIYGWHLWAEKDIPEGKKFITTSSAPPNNKILAPEVVLLAHYASLPTRGLTFSRFHVFKRDHFICQYCGGHPGSNGLDREDMTIDHVMPKSRGGATSWKNCVVACIKCNHSKADKTPEEAGMKLIKQPKKPKWSARQAFVTVGRKESWSAFVK